MEFSGFTDMSYDFKNKRTTYYKNIIFIKFDNKVYVEVSNYLSYSVILPFDELMKNRYLKMYYELSLTAIGKPNIDKNYYGCDDPDYVPKKNEKPYHSIYIDTVYIVEDDTTKVKDAKKGNTAHTINLTKLKNMGVSSKAVIKMFYEKYNSLYGFEEETFEEREKTYPALVSVM
jgi:hypothetical protein